MCLEAGIHELHNDELVLAKVLAKVLRDLGTLGDVRESTQERLLSVFQLQRRLLGLLHHRVVGSQCASRCETTDFPTDREMKQSGFRLKQSNSCGTA